MQAHRSSNSRSGVPAANCKGTLILIAYQALRVSVYTSELFPTVVEHAVTTNGVSCEETRSSILAPSNCKGLGSGT